MSPKGTRSRVCKNKKTSLTARNCDLVSALSRLKGQQRKAIIQTASKDLIETLGEIALNTLKGNLKLKPLVLRELFKHRSNLRKIGDKKVNWRVKRKLLLKQKGSGFFSILLPIVASLFGSLISKK